MVLEATVLRLACQVVQWQVDTLEASFRAINLLRLEVVVFVMALWVMR